MWASWLMKRQSTPETGSRCSSINACDRWRYHRAGDCVRPYSANLLLVRRTKGSSKESTSKCQQEVMGSVRISSTPAYHPRRNAATKSFATISQQISTRMNTTDSRIAGCRLLNARGIGQASEPPKPEALSTSSRQWVLNAPKGCRLHRDIQFHTCFLTDTWNSRAVIDRRFLFLNVLTRHDADEHFWLLDRVWPEYN